MPMKKLEDFISPRKPKKTAKSIYIMVRLDKRQDLLEWIQNRCKELGCSKNAYFLALIDLDKELTSGRRTK